MNKRRSLGDRNRAAITNTDTPLPASVDAGESGVPAASQSRTSTTATVRVTVRMSTTEWDEIRGAYLADWHNAREHDTFQAWAAAALECYAWRTPADRRFDDHAPTKAAPRMFDVPTAVADQVRAAMIADQRAGRYPTVSAWYRAALTAATETARERAGGQLPTPPKRLPGRLV